MAFLVAVEGKKTLEGLATSNYVTSPVKTSHLAYLTARGWRSGPHAPGSRGGLAVGELYKVFTTMTLLFLAIVG